MGQIIDEQGNPLQWKVQYYRYHCLYENEFDSLKEALDFIGHGEDYGEMSTKCVINPDGEVLDACDPYVNREQFEARYGARQL